MFGMDVLDSSTIVCPNSGPQELFVVCPISEIFFGGARGGGKTRGVLLKWIVHATKYKDAARGLIARRRYKDLADLILDSVFLLPSLGGVFNKSAAQWTFPSGPMKGAVLWFGHIWDVGDTEQYQGWGLTFIAFEEITNWPTPDPYLRMFGALRSARDVACVVVATGNPGGKGHGWVKSRWVNPCVTGFKLITDPESGLDRVFIPSKLEDNRPLMEGDPTYERRLLMLGSPEMVKAWRWGLWDITPGAYFEDVWRPDVHVLDPFPIPESWPRMRSFDWGSASPASVGDWAVSNGQQIHHRGRDLIFPRGSLIRVRESYVAKESKNGIWEGLRLTNQKLGKRIAEWSGNQTFRTSVADPSIFSYHGGPSIYQQMREGDSRIKFDAANNDRVRGWLAVKDMLEEAAEPIPEKPGLWVFANCNHFTRTVPILQVDDKDPDDVDTDQEDHTADESRYAVMTRSVTAPKQTRLGGH